MLETLQDMFTRLWHDLLGRPGGPMSFRFLLQPVMAIFFAMRDGLKDARVGGSPYFWTILTDPLQRGERLREGFKAVSRVIGVGIVMDAIYQYVALKAFYPLEMLILVFSLAFVPYLLMRGPTNRIACWWRDRHSHPHAPVSRK
jgi:hypothetical protein